MGVLTSDLGNVLTRKVPVEIKVVLKDVENSGGVIDFAATPPAVKSIEIFSNWERFRKELTPVVTTTQDSSPPTSNQLEVTYSTELPYQFTSQHVLLAERLLARFEYSQDIFVQDLYLDWLLKDGLAWWIHAFVKATTTPSDFGYLAWLIGFNNVTALDTTNSSLVVKKDGIEVISLPAQTATWADLLSYVTGDFPK